MSKATPVNVLYAELNEDLLASGAGDLQRAGFTVQTAIGSRFGLKRARRSIELRKPRARPSKF